MSETKENLDTREEPIVDPKVESLKVKTKVKPKKLANKNTNETPKIDFKTNTKTEEDAVQGGTVTSVQSTGSESVVEGVETGVELPHAVEPTIDEKQEVIIEEITDTEVKEEIQQELKENPRLSLPENVEKLVNFMKDTGGTVEDYVRLNADYTNVDSVSLLKEYYKSSKPHLNKEEIEFLLDDRFSYDEEYDDEKIVRKKQVAIKEEVAKAKGFLNDLKSKYYDEIKLRPNTTNDQQKAMDFFNRYNKEQEIAKQHHNNFVSQTNNYLSEGFKGFEFTLGEKQFRYKVNNPADVAKTQSDISSFVKTFLNEDGSVKDHKGYHKAIYAARNADSIANHFYEQGKADATKDIITKSKNITKDPRPSGGNDSIYLNGLRLKAISGVDSSSLKINKK